MYIIKLNNGQWYLMNKIGCEYLGDIFFIDIFNRRGWILLEDISTITPINYYI